MEHLEYEFEGAPGAKPPARGYCLAGVVSSGNLEVLLEQKELGGKCRFVIDTKAEGFGNTWQAVCRDFMARHKTRNLQFSIHDHAASPATVSLRLDQAWETLDK